LDESDVEQHDDEDDEEDVEDIGSSSFASSSFYAKPVSKANKPVSPNTNYRMRNIVARKARTRNGKQGRSPGHILKLNMNMKKNMNQCRNRKPRLPNPWITISKPCIVISVAYSISLFSALTR